MHHNFELSTCGDGLPVPEYLLDSFVIFQGVRTSIHKEIYSFVWVFFSGGGVQVSDPSMCRLGSGSIRPEVKSAPKSVFFVTVPKSCVLPQMAIFVLFTPG